MKRFLLIALGLVATTAPAAMAEFVAPTVYPEISFQHISPNGRYAVSEFYGFVSIFDLQEGTQKDFGPSKENDFTDYSTGLGNSVSNAGIVLGNVSNTNKACYYENGEWKELSDKGANPESASNLASAITPDGARICGGLGLAPMTTDDVTMMKPVYWDRLPDGTYGDPVPLPAPQTDFLGRVPQYITATSISADGKVIVGQVTDYSGMLQYPIAYFQDDKGEWSYKMLITDHFNTAKVELPEEPIAPEPPLAKDYMTEEQKAAYDEALSEYYKDYNPEKYPDALDYMSEEQAAKFAEDRAAYVAAFEEWSVLSDAFYAAWDQVLASSAILVFNSVYLTPDGKKYITSCEIPGEDPYGPSNYAVMSINLATDEAETFGGADVSLNACHVPNNDVIFGWDTQYDGYIVKDGQITHMKDYFAAFSPELNDWVKENMTHTVEEFNWDTFESVEKEILAVGMPIASEDLSVIATWVPVGWTTDDMRMAEGYVFKMDQYTTGVEGAVAAEGSISVDACGNIIVKGDVAALEVYNLNGVQVLSVARPEGVVATDFARGVYVARAILADGSVVKTKLVK